MCWEYDQIGALRRQDINKEIEHQLLVDSLDQDQLEPGMGRKTLGSIGRSLIAFGSWLQHIEHKGQQQAAHQGS
jgi:hypothetical protein